MNKEPLLKQVLGTDWDKLSPVLRQHYDVPNAKTNRCVLTGTMEIDYPLFITPLIKIIRLFGGLIDIKGQQVSTQVEKWGEPDNAFLHWRRTMQTADGQQTIFASKMAYRAENELVELINLGFGLRLKVSEDNGDLLYQSNGHLLKLMGFCIPIPDWLVLGHATIREHALSDNNFRLEFVIRHPLCGETYRYGGVFEIKSDD
ncbi:MAG: DUF4166 domain-containing protein [Methylococcaceae bacterium]|nr:DUF4166 domain-containing protein [Methylococcaceae bacterium]